MSRSRKDAARHWLVAGWINDAFGAGDETDNESHKHARDLIKFLKANGWDITQCTSDSQEDDKTQVDTSYRVIPPGEDLETKVWSN